MTVRPPPVTAALFRDLDTADAEEVKRRCGAFVRSLHAYLNDLPCLRGLQQARRRWKARTTHADAFGTFASDPNHWYTFHHGGRNEGQFNIGLSPARMRVGLGFEFSVKKGGDPTAVHLAYACFAQVIRRDPDGFGRFVAVNRLEVDWASDGGGPAGSVPTDQVVSWLLDPPRVPHWIFVGRLLRAGPDAPTLGDPDALGAVMEAVFGGFRPVWEQTHVMAHAP